jgi:hypothetical protein
LRIGLATVWGVLGLIAASAIALTLWVPAETWEQGEGPIWTRLSAAPCSGCVLCGMTRAFACLGRLELDRAATYHAWALPAWLLALGLALAGPWLAVRTLYRSR